jgi:DNA transformation protein
VAPAKPDGKGTARLRDRDFLAYVLDQLHGLRDVESRAMFGGHGIYQGAMFFAIVHRGRLYFRVGEATRPDYLAHGMKPFRPGPGQTLKRYYELPTDVLEDSGEAVRWARKAIRAGAEAKARSGG